MNMMFYGHNKALIPATFSVEISNRTATSYYILIRVTCAFNPPAEALGVQQTDWRYTSTNYDGSGSVITWVATFQDSQLISDAGQTNTALSSSFVVTFSGIDFGDSSGYYITNFPFSFTVPAF